MKTTHLKWIAISLSTLMLTQSCSVYDHNTATLDEVVTSQKQVMAKDYNGNTYKFKMLQREDDKLYGITTRNSTTAKKLTNQAVDNDASDRLDKFIISDKNYESYHLYNKNKSTNRTRLAGVFAGVIFGFLVLAANLSSVSKTINKN